MVRLTRWVSDGDYAKRRIMLGAVIIGTEYRHSEPGRGFIAWSRKWRVRWPAQQWQRSA